VTDHALDVSTPPAEVLDNSLTVPANDPQSTTSPSSISLASEPTPTPKRKTRPSLSTLRQAAIGPNHWYAVARCTELTDQPLGIVLWHKAIVLFRDRNHQIHALEDRCPHRQVRLSHGEVRGDRLECVYHGWQFNGAGACVEVPYMTDQQRLPNCQLSSYPVQEQDGFIWLYPGDPAMLAAQDIQPLPVPEWDHLNYIATVSVIDVRAHFSFLIENLMDMYHGRLHDDLQAWANPVLASIEETETQVEARYDAETYYKIDKIWSVSQLFFSALRQLRPTHLDVSYLYPHWRSTLGEDFRIYCLFCPVSETHTKAYLIHFTSLNAFHRLHKLPIQFRRWIKNRLFNAAKGMLDGLVQQDVLMMEDEQQAFDAVPNRKGPEFNPVIARVQQLIVTQDQG
jgi:phenylpropionate dioxygenase-like ring-hydroxylating dioxygenase large terminal subunit